MNPEHEVLDITEAELAFVDAVQENPDILGVWKIYQVELVDFWTVVRGNLYQAERTVAAAAATLFRSFPTLNFDFMVVPLADRALEEIIPPESITVYRRGEQDALSG